MIDYNTYNPVRAISLKGKLLTRLVRFGFRVRSIFGKKFDLETTMGNRSR
jgi:hypothetical protein